MSRLPYLRRDDLDPDTQQLWDSIVNARSAELAQAELAQAELINEHGGLIGPFNALMHAPGTGRRVGTLGRVLRFETTIERRLSEVAIITTGAHWKSEFEWWAHARMARDHGVPATVIDAIARGEDPEFEADDERTVHSVARQLAETGRIAPDTYTAAHDLLGDTGLVELVSLCGYYALISYLLNAFEVPLPPGVPSTWPPIPTTPA